MNNQFRMFLILVLTCTSTYAIEPTIEKGPFGLSSKDWGSIENQIDDYSKSGNVVDSSYVQHA